jgi:hypothetical protein
MTESAFNRPVPVQEQQAALKAEPKLKSGAEIINDEMLKIARDLQAREEAALVGQPMTAPDVDTTTTEYRGIDRAQFIDPIHPIPGIPASRELTEAEATKALEAVMQERIKEALDNDIETRARVAAIPVSAFAAQIIAERGEDAIRYEGTFQGNPIVSYPTMPPGVVGAVRLTAEQIAATKHLKPGEAWAKAGESLAPESPAKVEDLDEF